MFYFTFFRDECQNFLDNLAIYKQICQDHTEIDDGVRATVLVNQRFIASVKLEISIQDPVCELLREAEKKTCTLPDIIGKWLELNSKMPSCNKKVQACIDARLEMAITPLGLAAFFVDFSS